MTRPTIAKINAAIAARYPGRSIDLVKGAGYFYFSGDDGVDANVASIFICHLNHAPLERWLEIVFANIDEAL